MQSGFCLETIFGQVINSVVLIVVRFDSLEGGVGCEWEVYPGVRNQISLEFGQVRVQNTVEPHRGCYC